MTGSDEAINRSRYNQEILAALANLARALGKTELTVSDVKAHLPFGPGTLRKRWGSSRAAFVAAGLSLSIAGQRYTDEDALTTCWRSGRITDVLRNTLKWASHRRRLAAKRT